MKTEIFHLDESKIDYISKIVADTLKGGGTAVIPTDTLYGLVALDDIPEAVEKVYKIKNRPRSKKMIRLIGDVKLLKKYTGQYPNKLIEKYWPGPLTIVFQSYNGDTVALRCPDNNFLKTLFKHLGERAIIAPSANISGEENLLNCSDIVDQFNGKVEVIVCNDGPVINKASTIIDVSDGSNWRVIRQGELKVELQDL